MLFLAFAAWWLLAQVLGLVLPAAGWFLAGGLILFGGLGLIGALRSSRHNGLPTSDEAPGDTGPVSSPAAASDLSSDPLPERADTATGGSVPADAGPTTDPQPPTDRTPDLFGAIDQTPPSGRQGRDG
nr:hypothetical protein [Micromonospora sp. HNM0581]